MRVRERVDCFLLTLNAFKIDERLIPSDFFFQILNASYNIQSLLGLLIPAFFSCGLQEYRFYSRLLIYGLPMYVPF